MTPPHQGVGIRWTSPKEGLGISRPSFSESTDFAFKGDLIAVVGLNR